MASGRGTILCKALGFIFIGGWLSSTNHGYQCESRRRGCSKSAEIHRQSLIIGH